MTNLRRSLITPSYAQGFARCAGEAANPGLWRGLVGAWMPSLGPTGGTLFDISGNRNDGALTNMDVDADWIPGPDGYALNFDGSNNYVSISNSSKANISGNQMSISCWVTFRSIGNIGIVGKRKAYNSNVGYSFFINSSDKINYSISHNGSSRILVLDNLAEVLVDTLYFIVGIYDGSKTSLFINNIFQNSANTTGDLFESPYPLLFGAINDPPVSHLNGQISNILLYNRAFSQSEITQLYEDPHALVRRKGRVIQVRANNNVPQKFMHYSRMRSA